MKDSILYITDLYYNAQGRKYYEEDIYLTSRLKDIFDIVICHPLHSQRFEQVTDAIIFRNTGSVIYYKSYFDAFIERVKNNNILCYNSMGGKADIAGKKYLAELTRKKFPVIPTITRLDDIDLLPDTIKYIVKLEQGADSLGMRSMDANELKASDLSKCVIQPFIDFIYEVSFYFIDAFFQYALYAPDKNRRWQLEKYQPTKADLDFAEKFLQWNALTHGIQRVDACRTKKGELLLVELEDLNPYLSLDVLEADEKHSFVSKFISAISNLLQQKVRSVSD